jgi:hypothetical protein
MYLVCFVWSFPALVVSEELLCGDALILQPSYYGREGHPVTRDTRSIARESYNQPRRALATKGISPGSLLRIKKDLFFCARVESQLAPCPALLTSSRGWGCPPPPLLSLQKAPARGGILRHLSNRGVLDLLMLRPQRPARSP